MRRTLWWVERLALFVFAAITLPGATSAASAPAAAWHAGLDPTGASAAVLRPAPPGPLSAGSPDAPARDPAPALSPPLPSALPVVEVAPSPPLPPAQVVALYGYPGIPVMGALGRYDPDDAAAEVARLAAEWDAANGDRPAVGALHLITSVAQPWPMADGSYLARMSLDNVAPYVEAARTRGVLLILDLQLGMAEPLAEVERLRPFLHEPFVHVALDPEFAMRAKGGIPGDRIGSLDATEVNAVARYLGSIARAYRLPPKQLVLHQFRADMLTGTDAYEDIDGVTRIIDMDGWGGQGVKLDNYETYSLASYAQAPAIKLFYEWDAPLLGIEQLLALRRVPELVIYQ